MNAFKTSAYRSQVYQLRQLANNVLKQYDLKPEKLEFVSHGENTTFKIITRKGNYLLRIHRDGYHTQAGIKEELKWLNLLDNNGVQVQKPLQSIDKTLLTQGSYRGDYLERICTVLTWEEGLFRSKSVNKKHCKAIGRLLGQFHHKDNQMPIKARKYWHADGLLGKDDRFTGLFAVEEDLTKKQFAIYNECREALLSRLKDFENQFPQRSGLLHGDLHFGNVIWDGYKPIPIDFDDCGIGLHMYDLTIYLRSVKNQLSNRKQENQGAAYLEAMVDGYNSIGSLDKVDLELLPYLRLARSLTMFAWCYSRKDIEYIYEHFKKNKSKWIKQFQKFLTEGPERFFT